MSKTLQHLLKLPHLKGPSRLHKYDEVDEYLRSNPYIHKGYRGRLDFASCIVSTFCWHNETLNIWSHLLGFAFFAVILVKDFIIIPYHHSQVSLSDVIILVGVLLCYQACMMSSAIYHIFCCHSKSVNDKCLTFDVFGIALAIMASYLSGIYYAFYCNGHWRDLYLVTVGGFFLVAAGLQLSGSENHSFRIWLFALWGVYGLIPTVHWVWLHGGFESNLVAMLLPRVFIFYLILGIAFFFYVTKLPERIRPGMLDMFGHSHQLWHLLIFLALAYWHHLGVKLALIQIDSGCGLDASGDSDTFDMEALKVWPF